MGADAGLPLGALLYRISQYLLSAMGFERQAIVSRIDPFTGHFQYVRHAPSIQAALQEMPDFIKTRYCLPFMGLFAESRFQEYQTAMGFRLPWGYGFGGGGGKKIHRITVFSYPPP